MPEKYQVVDIIRNIGVYEGRETRLMNLNGGRTYNYMLENMFPQLRRVYYRIDYTVRPFTVEEGKEIMKTKPQQMSVFELYSVANTYRRGGSKEYNRAMQEAVEQFPQDPAAINNASAVALQEGRLGEAKALLDRTPPSRHPDKTTWEYIICSRVIGHVRRPLLPKRLTEVYRMHGTIWILWHASYRSRSSVNAKKPNEKPFPIE